MGAESSAGTSRGLLVGLENVRERRYRDAERALREKKANLDIQAAELGLENARTQRQWAQEDRPGEVQQRDYERGRQRVDDTYQDVTRAQAQDDRAHALARTDTLEGRADTTWQQGQQDRQRELQQVQATMENEGLREFVTALRNGADPSYSVRRFNRQGKLKIMPETFSYDRRAGTVTFTDSDGEEFNGTLDQLAALAGEAPAAPIKLGKDDRLIDPKTHQEIVGPSTEGGGGRSQSPYNSQTEQSAIRDMIEKQFAGINDPFGNYSVNEPEKERAALLVAKGTDAEGRLREHIMSGRVTRGEIVDAVMNAWKDVPNDTELQQRAERWRTQGFNKSPEQAAAWLDTERRRLYAAAEQKQAMAERRMLEGAAKQEGADTDEAASLPDAAKQAIQGLKEGETVEFRNGQVWSLANGKPQRVR